MIRKTKYYANTSVAEWSYAEKNALAQRVFRWCKQNMGINRRYKQLVSISVRKNHYEPDVYGAFCSDENQVVVYYNNIKKLRVLVGTIIHEYQHSRQPVKSKYYIYAKKYGYWKNPLEVDAREVEKKYLPIVIRYLNETNRK